ncbi:hypothetical protein L1987_07765 [Smallanthus sonchifolius]|uniref:Uncharacterized protein n=1 Tax=Smallanthus sonchifolius TaxID=185202 RepID=A0ACB9JIQ9_9ASTR|nr:hypothetical protein L1987_07765 [Smallanthus sonchifolius]
MAKYFIYNAYIEKMLKNGSLHFKTETFLSTMAAAPEDNTGSLKEQIAKVFEVSLKVTVSDEPEAYGRLFQKGSW